jgi:proline iminopeptidase
MIRHLGASVYNTMQGPNEFVVTGTFRDWNRWEDLHRIEVPTLLSVGRFDTMRVADIERMGTLIPHARVAVCEEGSHCSMYDDQENYFRA